MENTALEIKPGPKRAMILVIYLFLGFVLSLGVVIGKRYLVDLKTAWRLKNTAE